MPVSTVARSEILSGISQARENIQGRRKKPQKRRRLSQSRENQKDEETANDGSVWKIGKNLESVTGRRPQQNVLREATGPTSYAKRKIIDGNSSSA